MTATADVPARAPTPLAAGNRKRLLVASVSAGTGHVRAAEAVVEAMRLTDGRVQTVHVNVLEHATPGFRKFYEGSYSFLVNRAPRAWAQIYRWSDRAHGLTDRLLNHVQRSRTQAFLQLVDEFRPHRVIATHFLLPSLLEAVPVERRPAIDMVVTDFDVHRLWIHPLVDRYFVASELAARRLAAHGIPPSRIKFSGIPVHPVFMREVDGGAVRTRLGLDKDIPTVLLLAGGQGFGALDKAVLGLFSSPVPLQIISVAGRNEALKSAIDRLDPPTGVTVKSLGFVNNMHELMGAADLIVTKPGGLTVSEALARGAGLVLHSAIPGQEEKNAEHVWREGAGVRVEDFRQLPATVFNCLRDVEHMSFLRERAVVCGRPRAAFTIATAAVSALTAG